MTILFFKIYGESQLSKSVLGLKYYYFMSCLNRIVNNTNRTCIRDKRRNRKICFSLPIEGDEI